MNNAPVYYLNDNTAPQTDTSFIDGTANIISSIVAAATIDPTLPYAIKFVGAAVLGVGGGVIANEYSIDIGYNPSTDDIIIDNNPVAKAADFAVDAALVVGITDLAIAGLGFVVGAELALISLPALAIVGVVGATYSKFIDPITEDALATLAGKDMVQFFDGNGGDEKAGLIFPDGLPSTPEDALFAFITHPSSVGLDLTNGHVQIDTDLWPDNDWEINDASAFQTIADSVGVSLSQFLTT